jgi:hypothetical protein
MSICNINTTFKNVNNIGQDLLLNILESNLKTYLDWAFLDIGAWFDASIGVSGIYGTNQHSKLMLVVDPAYDEGQVWQGIRKDWVWETGVVFSSGSPINISGVYIDNNFNPYSSGDFIVDYPLGRIVFDTAIDEDSEVKVNYSYRYVQVYRGSDSPWFNVLQFSTYETNNLDISRTEDGDWSIGGQHRIQMPAIVIESLAKSRSRPYEIGNNNLIIEQDIAFHILAENKNDRNKLLDIIRLQQDSVIVLYNTNTIAQNDLYPLDYNGDRKNNALMYPDMVNQYGWRKCWIKNINLFEIESVHPSLFMGMARATTEIISE